MDLALQKFKSAALILTRSGSVKERLYAAYRQQLCDIDCDQLPSEVREDFANLLRAMTRERPLRGEDAAAATIRKLSAEQVETLAAMLIDLFSRMSSLGIQEQVRVIPSQPQGQVIPLFSAESRA
jgi:hypothetical protein